MRYIRVTYGIWNEMRVAGCMPGMDSEPKDFRLTSGAIDWVPELLQAGTRIQPYPMVVRPWIFRLQMGQSLELIAAAGHICLFKYSGVRKVALCVDEAATLKLGCLFADSNHVMSNAVRVFLMTRKEGGAASRGESADINVFAADVYSVRDRCDCWHRLFLPCNTFALVYEKCDSFTFATLNRAVAIFCRERRKPSVKLGFVNTVKQGLEHGREGCGG
ncbi:hypothetical protein [Silvibacterium sp.]|uniref:hypothetical protein n=1 Tax=Silvibacterium sp. TaxID=1964179 RepID=UPI0039E5B5CC